MSIRQQRLAIVGVGVAFVVTTLLTQDFSSQYNNSLRARSGTSAFASVASHWDEQHVNYDEFLVQKYEEPRALDTIILPDESSQDALTEELDFLDEYMERTASPGEDDVGFENTEDDKFPPVEPEVEDQPLDGTIASLESKHIADGAPLENEGLNGGLTGPAVPDAPLEDKDFDKSETSELPVARFTSNETVPVDDETASCLSEECFRVEGYRLARAWTEHPMENWCVPGGGRLFTGNNKNDNKQWQGLLLVKTPKAASTTTAGVVLRIAHQHGCAVHHEHLEGNQFKNRTAQSFLLSSMRHPNERAMSGIFFFIYSTNSDSVPTDEHVQKMLNVPGVTGSSGMGGFQLKYMTVDGIPPFSISPRNAVVMKNKAVALQHVKAALDQYQFLIVSERMDESLVAFALLTGLDLGDVIVTSNK